MNVNKQCDICKYIVYTCKYVVKNKCLIFIPCFFSPILYCVKNYLHFLNYVRSNLEHMSSDKKICDLFNFLKPFSFTHIRNVAIKHFVGANINNRAKKSLYVYIYIYICVLYFFFISCSIFIEDRHKITIM